MSKVLQSALEAKLAVLKGPEWDSSSSDEEETKEKSKKQKITKKRNISSSSTTVAIIDPHGSNKKKRNSNLSKKQQLESLEISSQKTDSKPSNVIYVGHLPKYFEEKELKGFLSQFGEVLNVQVSRCRKSGKSRGFGFVEFDDHQVAPVAADFMSGYLLMDKRLVCNVVPKDKLHPTLFRTTTNTGKRKKFKVVNLSLLFANRVDHTLSSVDGLKHISRRLILKDKAKRAKLASLGIDYSFPALKEVTKVEKRPMISSETEAMPTSKKKKMVEDKKNDVTSSFVSQTTDEKQIKGNKTSKATTSPKKRKISKTIGKERNENIIDKEERKTRERNKIHVPKTSTITSNADDATSNIDTQKENLSVKKENNEKIDLNVKEDIVINKNVKSLSPTVSDDTVIKLSKKDKKFGVNDKKIQSNNNLTKSMEDKDLRVKRSKDSNDLPKKKKSKKSRKNRKSI